MATVTDALVVQLSADIKGLQASLSDAQGSIRRFKSDAEGQINALTNVMGPLRAAFAEFVSIYGAFKVGKEIIDAGVQMQSLQNRMVAATGDAKVEADALAFVRETSDRLGLSFQTTADSFGSFSASALRSGMTLQQTKDVFNSVAEAATALHLSTYQTQSAFLALEQMVSKGTVQMQELKLQLAQAVPGAFEIMAKAVGVSVGQFNQMISKGELISSEVLPKFGDELHRQFGERAVISADSAQAAFNRLGNALFDLQTQLANSGLLDAVTLSVKEFTAALNDPAVKQGLVEIASGIGMVIEAALKLMSIFAQLSAVLNRLHFDPIANGFKALSQAVNPEGSKVPAVAGAPAARANPAYTLGSSTHFDPNAGKGERSRSAALTKVEGVEKRAAGEYDPDRLKIQLAEDQKILEDALAKHAITKKRFNEDMIDLQNDYAKRMKKYLVKQFGDEVDLENLNYDDQKEVLNKAWKDKLITTEKYQKQLEKLEKQHHKNLIKAENEANKERRSMLREALDGFLGIQTTYQEKTVEEEGASFREGIEQAGQHNKAFFELAKAAAVAKALLSARQSVVDAYKWGMELGGPPLAVAFAGVAAAAQAANVAAIASTSFGGGGSVSSTGGGGFSGDSSSTSTQGSTAVVAANKSVFIDLSGRTIFSKRDLRDLLDQIQDVLGDGYSLSVT